MTASALRPAASAPSPRRPIPILLAFLLALLPGFAAAQVSTQSANSPLDQLDRTGWPEQLTLGAGGQTTPYFEYGEAWAPIAEQALDLALSVEVTGGAKQNAVLVELGDLDLGMLSMGPALEAWTGNSDLAPGLRHRNIRALFPMYATPFVIAVRTQTGIADLDGLPANPIVAVGPGGSTADLYGPSLLDHLGIAFRQRNGSVFALTEQLRDGLVDAFAYAGRLPVPAWRDLDRANFITVFGFSPDQVASLTDALPVSPARIPASVHASQDATIETVAMWTFAIARADLPDSLIYGLMDVVFQAAPDLIERMPAFADTQPENWMTNTVLPFHPGAVQWYEDNGITIPEGLRG